MRVFGATPGSWLVRGYVEAVARFRERSAIGADSAREVYPPLFEALSWAHSLWDTWFRLVEPQDRHLDGLRYARDRCHHQLASAIYPDAATPGGWRWYAIGHLRAEGGARLAHPAEDPGLSGTQIHPSCCSGVFVDQSADSVASLELVWRVGNGEAVARALLSVVSARECDVAYGCCSGRRR